MSARPWILVNHVPQFISLFTYTVIAKLSAKLRVLEFSILLALLACTTSIFAQTNVALPANGGVASASSVHAGNYPPAATINGDRKGLNWASGGGWADGTFWAFPDWLQVTFSGVQSISEIDVFTIQDNYTAPVDPTPSMTQQYGITDFQVQYWNGGAWVDVPGGNVTGNNLVWRRFTFDPISTDRVRVLVNAAPAYSILVELEAWTTPGANLAPMVSLTAPANNAMLTAPATVSLSAAAADSDGTLSKVEFYRDSTLIATVTTPSSGTTSSGTYTASDTGVAVGTYNYTAKAYDNNGGVATSTAALVSVTATSGTSVNVAAQANGGVATASSVFGSTYPASGANDGDRKGLNWGSGGGWVDATAQSFPDWLQVTFSGVQSIGEIDVFMIQDTYWAPVDPTSSMTFAQFGIKDFQIQYWNGAAWADVPNGNVTGNNLVWRRFTFAPISTDRVRVLVNASAYAYSILIELEAWTATGANVPPTVSLTAPANNTTLTALATVNLSAAAADSDGTISKVEFYRDTTLVATVTTPSSGTTSSGTYTASDTSVAVGTYSYTAKAYDNANPSAVTTSGTAQVNVTAGAAAAQIYYVHTDHLNTPRLITNQTQQAVWRWDHAEPFGTYPANENPSGLGAFEFNARFPGQYFDKETNLHYNYFRDYDPAIGRYIQSDPIGLAGGINTYSYVGENPLSLIDLDGLRVTVYSRLVDDPRAKIIRARHAWLNLEPDNLAQVQCMLQQAGLPALSFPLRIGGYAGPTGNLIVAANAPSDDLSIVDPNRLSRVLSAPRDPMVCSACGVISPDSQFIFGLVTGAAAYKNNLPYNPTPITGDGYNSNSFAQGLLNSTGFSGGLGVGNTVGSGKPVPPSAFGR